MNQTLDELKATLSTLSPTERADLAHFLLTSLEPHDTNIEEAWRVEIAQRVTEIRTGRAKGRPVEEALTELRDRHP